MSNNNTVATQATAATQTQSAPTTYNIINAVTNACTRAPYEVIDIIQHPSHLGRVFDINDEEEESVPLLPASNEGKGLPSNTQYVQ